jgi:hypothetical protein
MYAKGHTAMQLDKQSCRGPDSYAAEQSIMHQNRQLGPRIYCQISHAVGQAVMERNRQHAQ